VERKQGGNLAGWFAGEIATRPCRSKPIFLSKGYAGAIWQVVAAIDTMPAGLEGGGERRNDRPHEPAERPLAVVKRDTVPRV